MPKQKRTRRDFNVIAKSIVDRTISESEGIPLKDPGAVAHGRLGGLKGGKARAKKLTSERKKEIARRAAEKRWAHRPKA